MTLAGFGRAVGLARGFSARGGVGAEMTEARARSARWSRWRRAEGGNLESWVREHAASLDEIEKAMLRITAIRVFGTMTAAAARLRMVLPALYRWMDDRNHGGRR